MMTLENQRHKIQIIREQLIKDLEELYTKNFNDLIDLGLGDSLLAKITQLLLTSREAAINPLKKSIESPLITKAKENFK